MVISISKKLWNLSFTDDSTYKIIKKILSWVEDGKHNLIFENGIDADKIIKSKEYSNYSETIKSLVTEQYYSEGNFKKVVRITDTKALNTDGKKSFYNGLLLIQYDDVEYHYIDVSKIDTYLGRLLYITVENTLSDKGFIQAAYRALRGRELCTEREVQFLHGGGNTTDIVISQNSTSPTRMVCIVDSDRKHSSQAIGDSEKVRNLMAICEDRNLPLIVLERREIENYLPVPILNAWLSKENREREKEHPFFLFNSEQRSFFDMKKGLKEKDMQTQEVANLYNNLVLETLPDGFGRTVWQAFELIKPNEEAFKEEHDPEIYSMVNMIESLI